MKKLAAIFLVLLFTSPVSAQVIMNPTTNARMDALGVDNWQIEDDFNIWINPAQINMYKNSVYLELGEDHCNEAALAGGCGSSVSSTGHDERNDGAYGGAHMSAPYGNWGFYLGRPYSGSLNMLEALGSGTAPEANRLDLFYGQGNFGFYLGYADRSDETDDKAVGLKDKDESGEINIGAGGVMGALEGALNVGLPSGKCNDNLGTVTCGNQKEDGSMNFSLLVRHKMPIQNGTLLTTVKYIMADVSVKDSVTGDKTDADFSEWHLSTAINSMPNPDTLIVLGIGIESSTFEAKDKAANTKYEEDTFRIPLNVGLEHQTFKRVKTRFGISKPLYDSRETKDTAAQIETESVADGEATVSAGLGIHIGDGLEVDLVINQDVFFTGTYFVSGVPETVNSVISLTYRFN